MWAPVKSESAQCRAHKRHLRFLQIVTRLQMSYAVAARSVWPSAVLFTEFQFCLKKSSALKNKNTSIYAKQHIILQRAPREDQRHKVRSQRGQALTSRDPPPRLQRTQMRNGMTRAGELMYTSALYEVQTEKKNTACCAAALCSQEQERDSAHVHARSPPFVSSVFY